MTDLEKRAEEYLQAKWGTGEMLILGGDARKVLAEFAEQETDRLSKHILELQADKGRLTDEVDTLKLQISELINQRQYWKDSSFDWRHKFFKKGLVKRLVKKDKQLNKAKEIIRELLADYNDRVVSFEGIEREKKTVEIKAKVEAFLKE